MSDQPPEALSFREVVSQTQGLIVKLQVLRDQIAAGMTGRRGDLAQLSRAASHLERLRELFDSLHDAQVQWEADREQLLGEQGRLGQSHADLTSRLARAESDLARAQEGYEQIRTAYDESRAAQATAERMAQESLKATLAHMGRLRGELEQTQQQLHRAQEERATVSERSDKEREQLSQRLTTLQAELDSLQAAQARWPEERDRLRKEREAAQARLAHVRDEWRGVASQLSEKKAQLEGDVAALQRQLEHAQAQLEPLQEAASQRQREQQQLLAQLRQVQQEVIDRERAFQEERRRLVFELSAARRSVTSLEQDREDASARVRAAQRTAEEPLRAEKARLADQLREQLAELEHLRGTAARLAAEREVMVARVKRLEEELQARSDSAAADQAALKEQLASFNTALESLAATQAGPSAHWEAERERLINDLGKLQSELAISRQQLGELEGLRDLRQGQEEALRTAEPPLRAENARLSSQLAERLAELQHLTEEFQRLGAERDAMDAQVRRLEATLETRSASAAAGQAALQARVSSISTELETLRVIHAGASADWQEEQERLLGELRRRDQDLQAREAAFLAERESVAAELEILRGAQAQGEEDRQHLLAQIQRVELSQLPALQDELQKLTDERAKLLDHIQLVEQHWYQREAGFDLERAGWRRELDHANLAFQEASGELGQTRRRRRMDRAALLGAGLLALVVGLSLALVPLHSDLPVQPVGGVLSVLVAAAFFTYAFRAGASSAPALRRPEGPTWEPAPSAPQEVPAAPRPATVLQSVPAAVLQPVPAAERPLAAGRARGTWRGRFLTALLLVGLLVGVLPILAILHGAVDLLSGSRAYQGASWIGLFLAFTALSMGTIFFAYSIKYYLATVVVVLGFGGARNGDGHGQTPGRFQQRGQIAKGSGNDTMTDWLPTGAEPFVSVHIATYNEKRVIERLLEACNRFEYPNYEVIVVDDSTDESIEILERWKALPRFKIIHRPTRDGFKGGALQEALRVTDPRAQYVVVFDADSIPFPDSIQRLLYHFYEQPGEPSRR